MPCGFTIPDYQVGPPKRRQGGFARGVSAERFETPLAGGAAARCVPAPFCWRAACQRRGGNPPAPAFPRRGKRERGRSNFLAAAGKFLCRVLLHRLVSQLLDAAFAFVEGSQRV